MKRSQLLFKLGDVNGDLCRFFRSDRGGVDGVACCEVDGDDGIVDAPCACSGMLGSIL